MLYCIRLFASLRFVFSCSTILLQAWCCLTAHCAPIPIRFTAEVELINEATPFDYGIDVEVGDTLTGRFFFEHVKAAGQASLEVTQYHTVSVMLNGSELVTPPEFPFIEYSSTNDGGIEDFPPAQKIDTLEIFSQVGPANADAHPSIDPANSSFQIRLFGDVTVLDSPQIPDSESVWNSFKLDHRLAIILESTESGIVFIGARIDKFEIVPEPEMGIMLLLLLSTFGSRAAQHSVNNRVLTHGG